MAWGILPVVAALLLAARPVLSLFGTGYPTAAPALRFLVIANGAWAAAALPVLWLHYTGRGTHVVAVTLATLVLDSVLNLLLIPRYGMEGAAGATAATMLLAAAAVFAIERYRAPGSPAGLG